MVGALFHVFCYPKDPAVLKILRVVNLLRVVFLVRRGDLLSRRTLYGHHFPGNQGKNDFFTEITREIRNCLKIIISGKAVKIYVSSANFSATLTCRRKSWTSAPKSAFFCSPGGGEKLFDPGASGRKGQECLREIRTEKFMLMLFFSFLIKMSPLGPPERLSLKDP